MTIYSVPQIIDLGGFPEAEMSILPGRVTAERVANIDIAHRSRIKGDETYRFDGICYDSSAWTGLRSEIVEPFQETRLLVAHEVAFRREGPTRR